MSKLSPCPRCRRLLRVNDGTCPFCFATRTVALAAILPLAVACQRGSAANDAGAATSASSASATTSAVASASASPSDTVAPLAPLVASATPSAIASARQASIGRDGGTSDPELLAALSADAGSLASVFGDSGIAVLGTVNPGIGAYGAPPRPGLTGLPGIGAYGGPPPGPGLDSLAAGNVASSMSGGHTPFDDRVVASRRSAMRVCYTSGLKLNPQMAGKVKASVSVSAAGTATVTATPEGGVSNEVAQCIAGTLRTAVYEPSAHTFQVDLTLTKP